MCCRLAVPHWPLTGHAVSNFGTPWQPACGELLAALVEQGLVDEVVPFEPATYTPEQKKRLVSPRATGTDLGCNDTALIGDQFFNELRKREIGRLKCLAAGCKYFMSLDTDECYVQAQLAAALRVMVDKDYHAALCK